MRFGSAARTAGAILLLGLLVAPAHGGEWIYYTSRGDTLWDLCLKYTNKRGCWIELARYNKVRNDRVMPVGTELRIPSHWLVKPPVVGHVLSVSGDVVLEERAGQRREVRARELLHLDDTLISNDGSARIRLGQGDEVLLRPNSRVRLDNLTSVDSSRQAGELELPEGEVELQVVPERGTRFRVQTPAAIAAVRGTSYRVASSAPRDPEMKVEVLDGAVQVDGQESERVDEGFGLKARQDQPLGELTELLPAPSLEQAGATLRQPFTLAWNADPGARRWQLDFYNSGGERTLLSTELTEQPEFRVDGLEKACYQLVLSAVDAEGFRGLESESRVCVGDPMGVASGLEVVQHKQRRWGHDWTVAWDAVDEASGYVLQIAEDEQFEQVLRSEQLAAPRLDFSDLPNGRYYLRVAAVDDQGHQGDFGEPLPIHQFDTLGASLVAYSLVLLLAL